WSQQALKHLNELEQRLRLSSSFLDRLEEVGFIARRDANAFGLLGPVARASGRLRPLVTANRSGGVHFIPNVLRGKNELHCDRFLQPGPPNNCPGAALDSPCPAEIAISVEGYCRELSMQLTIP